MVEKKHSVIACFNADLLVILSAWAFYCYMLQKWVCFLLDKRLRLCSINLKLDKETSKGVNFSGIMRV